MLDIKFIRENKEIVQENTKNRKVAINIDELLADDDLRKELQVEIDALRRDLNASSKSKPTPEQIKQLREKGNKISILEKELKEIQGKIFQKQSWIPNLSSPDMPIGKGEDDNVELAVWTPQEGYLEEVKLGSGNNSLQYMHSNESGKHHIEIGEALDIIDNKQSALTSGSRFTYLKGDGALLEYALFDLLSKKLIRDGFTPMIPPLMVKEQVLFGTSHFPEGREQVYKIDRSNVEEGSELFLVGSAEPALFSYYMDQILPEKDLPIKMFALTPCFRSEVGSWGKDVRGIKRVHQFDKLEMNVVAHPSESNKIFEQLREVNEWLLQSLKIPYRVLNKCTGDCGYAATYKQYDVEVWLPAQKEFMEVMTDTNATDYQARRLNIKFRSGEEKEYVHTVNDTGIAMGRMIIAIIDNYQQPDGTVKIPDVLQEYMGKDLIASK
jgi:seryl-tRNA synthetase